MKILVIILSALKALELFLSLKNKSFLYDIRSKSKIRQNELIEEINKLRNKGDSNSSDRADILLLELEAERAEIEHLSAVFDKAKKRSPDSNN